MSSLASPRFPWSLVLVVAACRAPATASPPSPSSPTSSTPSGTESAEETGLHTAKATATADTGPVVTPITPPLTGMLPPTWTIEAPELPNFGDRLEVVPADQGDLLAIDHRAEGTTTPSTVFLEPSWPRGTHHVLDVWDGVSGWDGTVGGTIHAVGDADGDDEGDYWLSSRLVAGPLLGRHHAAIDLDGSQSIAFTEPRSSGDYPMGFVHGAGFDADHDGHHDVLLSNTTYPEGNDAWVAFGPFAGEVLVDPDRPATRATLGHVGQPSCYENPGLQVVRDYLGPGRHAVAYGGPDWGHQCSSGDLALFALEVDPGGSSGTPLALFDLGSDDAVFTDDVDGDGQRDTLCGDAWRSAVLAGPVNDYTTWNEARFDDDLLPTTDGEVARVLGDVNGDGVNDYLVQRGDQSHHVHLSPFSTPLSPDPAIEVAPFLFEVWSAFDRFHLVTGDFDDDGLGDFAYTGHEEWGATSYDVHVYLGADVVATWEARQLSPPAR